MSPIKRFELVVEAVYLDDFLKTMEAAGIDGYTVISDITGKGSRGIRRGDELTDVSRNCCIIAAVPLPIAENVVNAVRPLLNEYGGMCLVSDANWMIKRGESR